MSLAELMAKYAAEDPKLEAQVEQALPKINGAQDVSLVWWPKHNGFTDIAVAAPGLWTNVPEVRGRRISGQDQAAREMAEILRDLGVRLFISDSMSFHRVEVACLKFDAPYGVGYLVRDDWSLAEFDYLRGLWMLGGRILERRAMDQEWRVFRCIGV